MTVAKLLGVNFHQLAGRDICLVTVEPSDHPIFVERRNQAAFWLRVGNGTRELPVNEAVAYIQRRWGSSRRLTRSRDAPCGRTRAMAVKYF